MVYGCWHSDWCRDGELGSNPLATLRRITQADFEQAQERGWPHVDSLTNSVPVMSTGHINERGEFVLDWDSLHGDAEKGA